MSSITIHNLDDPLDSMIREKAKKEGLSLNNTIKKLLHEAVGLTPRPSESREQEFLDLFGVWSAKEAKAFHQQISELEKIDQSDWK